MEEMIPVTLGVVLGVVIARLVPPRGRGLALAIGSVVLGTAASWITGELAASALYILVDSAQTGAVAALTWLLLARWRQRRPASLRRAA